MKKDTELQSFPKEIYEGLQTFKKKPLHVKAKKVVVSKCMTDEEIAKKEGKYFE